MQRALAMTVLLLAAISVGCTTDGSLLAVVGDETITIGDFIEAARGGSERYGGDPDSAKALLLKDLVQRKLLILEARKLSAPNQDLLDTFRGHVEREVLTAALFERLAPQDIRVTDDEARRFHALRDSSAHIRVVYHPERVVTAAALRELQGGAGFAGVADRFSLPGLLPPGGDFGFLIAGALVDPLDRLMREAPIGKLIGPIEAPGEGWFIVQIVERRARALEPFVSVKEQIREMLLQRKRRALSLQAMRRLERDYRLTIEPGAPQVLFARFNPSPEGNLGAGTSPEDHKLDRVLARYDGGGDRSGTYTLLDALEDLESGAGERPDPSLTTALEEWIQSQVLKRIAYLEARRRHLDQEPDIERRMQERFDNKLVDDIYHAEVEEKTPVTPGDREAAQTRLGLGSGALEDMPIQDQSNVRQLARRLAQERRFQVLLSSLRDRYPVQTYPERLLAIAWPVAGADPKRPD